MFFDEKSSDDEGCMVDSEGKGYMKTEALCHCGIPIKLGGQEKMIVKSAAGESRREKIVSAILDIGQP